MKKLIGDPARVVADMVDGLVRADGRLARLADHAVIFRADAAGAAAAGRVALISGGGSGHEPAHAGYVGAGMLTAAVLGAVFASPGVDAVLAAIRAVTGPAGCLLIVKNYTGDRLNFGLAAAIARSEGLAVEMVLVDDDAALPGSGRNGRRGLAGTVLVHKIAGAAAAAGLPLSEVRTAAERAIGRLATMSVALSACTMPGAPGPGFRLAEDEIELGLGIHGEPGVERAAMAPVDSLVDRLIATLLGAPRDRPRDVPVVLLVNGLGATPMLELTLVTRAALAALAARGIEVARTATGTFLSALDMAGASITLLSADHADLDRLDAPTTAAAWPILTTPPAAPTVIAAPETAEQETLRGPQLDPGAAAALRRAVEAVLAALSDAEPHLTDLDQAVGDGDLGISLARGAAAVGDALPTLPFDRPASLLTSIAAIVRRAIGGSSGPITAALLVAAGDRIAADGKVDWARAFAAGCEGVTNVGGARAGDRTMLDALLPAVDALAAGRDPAAAAAAGAEATRHGAAAVGRSSYLGDRVIGHPDPGAVAVAIAIAAAIGSTRR